MSAPIVSPSLRASETTAYDSAKYGSKVDWTKTSILIDGRPVCIISAEFHYFRVPDRERWRPLLRALKGAGFNAVRLYFHWGYHSPAPGIYNFRGNRDIDLLLRICTELQLFVIAAPGPYICAEVQAGGFPIWLVAQRHLRVRHLTRPPIGLKKEFDHRFHGHCVDYLKQIIPIIAKHERTQKADGCVIALQIENELREQIAFGIGGLDDEIRLLAQVVRDAGSSVPFFHNDDAPIGSWSSGTQKRSLLRMGKKGGPAFYRTDMYGFDLYFTFPPGDKSGDRSSLQVGMIELCGVSSCINLCGFGGVGVGGSDTECISCLYHQGLKSAPPPQTGWAKAGQMPPATDNLEKTFSKIGGSAENCPVICAETQVGWINQWGRLRGYDEIYDFFGPDFSATLQTSLIAQGVNVINHYMAYGGTNHGSLGDAEVYTSYDYSAFIREFGHLSGRGRNLRHVSLFCRSFAQIGLANTEQLKEAGGGSKSRAFSRVKATLPGALLAVREVVFSNRAPLRANAQAPMFAFLRNLSGESSGLFNLFVDDVVVPAYVPVNQAAIMPLYHDLSQGWCIFASTVQIICREAYAGSELWVLRVREAEKGRIIFRLDPSQQTTGHGLVADWSFLDEGADDPLSGSVRASDSDEGAATSFLRAPLEELPHSAFDMFGDSRAPVALRASTEPVGLCFSTGFSGKGDAAVAVSLPGADRPLIRFICLSDEYADTFTADVAVDDPYVPLPAEETKFSAAWGVSQLSFCPDHTLEMGHSTAVREKAVYLLRDSDDEYIPEQFMPVSSVAVQKLLPSLVAHLIPSNALKVALQHGVDRGNPLDKAYELPVDGWTCRLLDWKKDTKWKPIEYKERDPLDHHMTSGHVAYRLRFKATDTGKAHITINVRHTAAVWCNGRIIGRQVCYSHNACSAGSMHAVDLSHSGKKKHRLSAGMQNSSEVEGNGGFHEVIILVFSCGQSRSPFLLNDVRNKRGLLSAKLRARGVTEKQWSIAGVDVTRGEDAYGSSGLPFEDDANDFSFDSGFTPVGSLAIAANAGVNYFRSTFRTPSNAIMGGSVRYPLRIKVVSAPGVVAMLWVNGLLIGRYVADLGPQTDFYVPEGLIKECKKNGVVVAAYGDIDSTLSIQILPWVVCPHSGNIDEANGEVFALRTANFRLTREKDAVA